MSREPDISMVVSTVNQLRDALKRAGRRRRGRTWEGTIGLAYGEYELDEPLVVPESVRLAPVAPDLDLDRLFRGDFDALTVLELRSRFAQPWFGDD